jgi:curved DNA-binding protein CbpA
MRGTLTTICLPDLLRTIYMERRSGELALRQGEVKKQIYFELGQIVFAASNRREDRLGEALVRHGKLTREELEKHLETLGQGRHLGKTLVERSIISDRELISYVTFQLVDIIYSLFTWTIGAYDFSEGEQNRAPEELKLRFSTATIILEGVRRIEDFDVIRRGLGDLNRLIALTTSPLLRLQSITLKPLERQILDLVVAQPMDILRLLIASHEQPQRVFQALFGLLSVGLLQQVAAGELSSATGKFTIPVEVQNQAEASAIEERANSAALPRSEVDTLQSEIAILKARIANQDAFAVLEVKAEATAEEVRNAYYKMATKFHPDRFIQAPRHIRADIDYIFARITDSYNALRNNAGSVSQRPATTSDKSAAQPQPSAYTAYQSQNYQTQRNQIPTNLRTSSSQIQAQEYRQMPNYESQQSARGFASSSTNPSLSQTDSNPNSIDVEYPRFQMHRLPQRSGPPKKEGLDVETALNDLLEYLDDRKAPLFVADSLSMLLRTKAPFHIEQARIVETVVVWSRQKASVTGRPIHEVLVDVLSSIKHAEQARVIQDFDPNLFYASFIRELAIHCPPSENQLFLSKVGSI